MVRKFLTFFFVFLCFSHSYALDCSVFVGGCDSSATATTLSNGIQIPGDCQCDYQTILNANLTLINNNIALIGGLNTWSQLQTFSDGIATPSIVRTGSYPWLQLGGTPTVSLSEVWARGRTLRSMSSPLDLSTMAGNSGVCSGGDHLYGGGGTGGGTSGTCSNNTNITCLNDTDCADFTAPFSASIAYRNYDIKNGKTANLLNLLVTYNYKTAGVNGAFVGNPYNIAISNQSTNTDAASCSVGSDCGSGGTCGANGKCRTNYVPYGMVQDWNFYAKGAEASLAGYGYIDHVLNVAADGAGAQITGGNWSSYLANNFSLSSINGAANSVFGVHSGFEFNGADTVTAGSTIQEIRALNLTDYSSGGSAGTIRTSIYSPGAGVTLKHVGKVRLGSLTEPTVMLDVTGAGKVSTTFDVIGASTFTGNVRIGSGTAATVPLDVTGAAAISADLTVIGSGSTGSPTNAIVVGSGGAQNNMFVWGALASVGNLSTLGTFAASGALTSATVSSTNASGTNTLVGTTYTAKNGVSSTQPHTTISQRTAQLVRSSTTAADFLSLTFTTAPAASRIIRVRSAGTVQMNNGAGNTNTFKYQVTFGGAVVCDTGSLDPATVGGAEPVIPWSFEGLITVRTAGGASTAVARADCWFRVNNNLTSPTTGIFNNTIDASTSGATMGSTVGPSAGFSLAANAILKTNVVMSTSHASNSMTEETNVFELLN